MPVGVVLPVVGEVVGGGKGVSVGDLYGVLERFGRFAVPEVRAEKLWPPQTQARFLPQLADSGSFGEFVLFDTAPDDLHPCTTVRDVFKYKQLTAPHDKAQHLFTQPLGFCGGSGLLLSVVERNHIFTAFLRLLPSAIGLLQKEKRLARTDDPYADET